MYDIARERSYQTPLTNSSLLPLMLMSLATQQNAPKITQTPSSIYSEYDYIIVGAGSAGSTLAGRLSEMPCADVLLLEAGGGAPLLNDVTNFQTSFFRTDLDWNYTTVPQKNIGGKQIPWLLGRGFGGTSLINSNLYERGFSKNYNKWAQLGAKGWSYDDVLPYFKKLENYQNPLYADNGYHGTEGPVTIEIPKYKPKLMDSLTEAVHEQGYDFADINGPNKTGFYVPEGTLRDAQRCSTAKAYLVPAESRRNLHLLPFAFVHKIMMENNKAVGIYFEVDGTVHEVRARKEVILSAGTVNSAKLLMLSGIGPKDELQKHGITVLADLPVGKNLLDNSAAMSIFLLSPESIPVSKQLMDEQNIMDYIQHRKGPYASLGFMQNIAALRGSSAQEMGDSNNNDPTYNIYFTQSLLPDSFFQDEDDPKNIKSVLICLIRLTDPKSAGTITLNSADPHDPPLIDPNYQSDGRDVKDFASALKVCHKVGTSDAMKKIGTQPLNTTYPGCKKYLNNKNKLYRCMAKTFAYPSNHQAGTAKMGDPNESSTVVDPQLRVKNIEGLRVVDASVMPIMPGPDINVPVIMIAEKAADLIKKNIKCSKR